MIILPRIILTYLAQQRTLPWKCNKIMKVKLTTHENTFQV